MVSAEIGGQSKNNILQALVKLGPLSRADLARILGLSSPTMTSNVKTLLEAGLLIEGGEADNSVGRRATLLRFNAAVGYVIGIDVERNEVNSALTNLVGDIKASTFRNSRNCNGEELYALIASSIDELISRADMPKERILCLCVGVPGIFDEKTGVNQFGAYVSGWSDIPLKNRLQEKYCREVVIENNCNVGGIGEKWKGAGQDCDNFLYIDYNVGIGAAIIINGELYRGANGASGELGYMMLDRHYLRRQFQQEGALEDEICVHAIKRKLDGMQSAEDFFELIDLGDPKVLSFSSELIVYLGMCISNAIATLNPKKVIISGELGTGLLARYKDRLINVLETHVPFIPEVVTSQLGSMGHVLGAVFTAIEKCTSDYKNLIESDLERASPR